MTNAANTPARTNETLTYGELVHDALDNRTYRFARYDVSPCGFRDVVLMDDAGRELPDTRMPHQIRRVSRRAA